MQKIENVTVNQVRVTAVLKFNFRPLILDVSYFRFCISVIFLISNFRTFLVSNSSGYNSTLKNYKYENKTRKNSKQNLVF